VKESIDYYYNYYITPTQVQNWGINMDRSAARATVSEIVWQFNNNRKSKCLLPFPQLPEGESYVKPQCHPLRW